MRECLFFFFQAEDGIRDVAVTGVQTCALPIYQTQLDLALPCTYDFEVTGSKYLHALREGTIPLALLFSGTIFTRGANGFGVEQVAWDCEASYALPVSVWQQMIELNYPHTGWLRDRKST